MHRLILLALTALALNAAEKVGPALPQAHAHNDYEHTRPLLDALAHGFTSVEADIYLVDGKLLVAHDRADLKPERTLAALYLDPLRELARGKKSIFDNGQSLTLLIDIKTEAEPTYTVLRELLVKYREMLTAFKTKNINTVNDWKFINTNAVTIILSGNRPRDLVVGENDRFVAIDGRLTDLAKKNLSVSLIPLISDNWNNHFQWRGTGPFPESDRAKLKSLVEQTHAEHRRIRFWATPDNETAWAELRAAGVDLINTDKLAGLAEFLRKSPAAQKP